MPEMPTNRLFNQMQLKGTHSGDGEPVSAVPTTPDYIGQLYFDAVGEDWYMAISTAPGGWKVITSGGSAKSR